MLWIWIVLVYMYITFTTILKVQILQIFYMKCFNRCLCLTQIPKVSRYTKCKGSSKENAFTLQNSKQDTVCLKNFYAFRKVI